MATAARRIRLEPQSVLAAALRDATAAGEPVELEANGRTYHVVAMPSITPDRGAQHASVPGRITEALERYAGAWADVDADELIAATYRAREEGSRSANRR